MKELNNYAYMMCMSWVYIFLLGGGQKYIQTIFLGENMTKSERKNGKKLIFSPLINLHINLQNIRARKCQKGCPPPHPFQNFLLEKKYKSRRKLIRDLNALIHVLSNNQIAHLSECILRCLFYH